MLSIAGTGALAAATGTGTPAAAPQPRLVKAAHEFEAQMMQELLKPLTAGSGFDGEEGDGTTGSGGTLGAIATEALGRGLSEQGGFGIANSIVRQLTRASNQQVTTQVTGDLHGNTVMKPHE